jgi:hypothetical protein
MGNAAYIYSITDIILNIIVYVGQHNGNNKYYEGSSLVLSKYKKKYGTKKFRERYKINILEYCDKDKLNDREIYYIKFYNTFNSGFNLTEGGNNLSKNTVKGRTFPIKSKKLKGIKRSLDTKHLMKISKINYKPNILCHENRIKSLSKPVLQYDLDGNFIKEWINGKEAANILNIKSYGDISACCLNKQKTAHGFMWFYKKEDNIILKINPKEKNQYPKDRKSKNEKNS